MSTEMSKTDMQRGKSRNVKMKENALELRGNYNRWNILGRKERNTRNILQ
jgi:hypothetical protein